MTFTFKLKRLDGTPADPSIESSTMPVMGTEGEPTAADASEEEEEEEEEEAPTAESELGVTITQFHRTLQGIRELRAAAAPHIASSEDVRLPHRVFAEMTPQDKSALGLMILQAPEQDETAASDTPSEAGDRPDHNGDERSETKADHPNESSDDDELGGQFRIEASGTPTMRFEISEDFADAHGRVVANEISTQELLRNLAEKGADVSRVLEFFRSLAYARPLDPDKEQLLNSSMLITAVATFETLIARVLTVQFNVFPGLIEREEKQFSLKDLQDFGTIDDARDDAIERRVDALMRAGFEQWEDWLDKRAKIEFRTLCADYDAVHEVLQRRNVVVHAAGKVSRQYLNATARTDVSLGDVLLVDAEYLESALDELDVLGVALATRARTSWLKDESQDALTLLHNTAYDLLVAERYAACRALCRVGLAIGAQGWLREAMRVNSWIAQKRSEGPESIREDVSDWDTSALASEFVFAKTVLLDELDDAFEMLPRMLETEAISEVGLVNWPLFRELRADPRYEKFAPTTPADGHDGGAGSLETGDGSGTDDTSS